MSKKAYKEVRPQINFEPINNRNLQEIMRIQHGDQEPHLDTLALPLQVKERIQELSQQKESAETLQVPRESLRSSFEHKHSQTLHEPNETNSVEYQKMFEICQKLNQEKAGLLDTIDQLKSLIADQEKQLSKLAKLGSVYQKESSNSKDKLLAQEREIEALQLELENYRNQFALSHNEREHLYAQGIWVQQLGESLNRFLVDQNLEDLHAQMDPKDPLMNNQIVVEYLMEQFTLKKAQEQKYEAHIRENIQIIYDLQNKITDLAKASTPKSQMMDTLKLSKLSSASNLLPSAQLVEANAKINCLKRQGKRINRKWQLFCEQILKEKNEIIKREKQIIDRLTETAKDHQDTILEMIQYFAPKQKLLWSEVLDSKQRALALSQELLSADFSRKSQLESELKLVYKKINFQKQQLLQTLHSLPDLKSSESQLIYN